MKESGLKAWNQVKDRISLLTKMFILGHIKMGFRMEIMDFIDGLLVHHFKVSFWMQWKMEKENGKSKKDNWIQISTLGITYKIRNMVTESLPGKVEIFTKENIKMTKGMDVGNLSGLMGQYIKEIGSLELSMAKENYGCQMESIKMEFLKIINLKLQFKIKSIN